MLRYVAWLGCETRQERHSGAVPNVKDMPKSMTVVEVRSEHCARCNQWAQQGSVDVSCLDLRA